MATANLSAIAENYIRRFRKSARSELLRYRMQRSLRDAVCEASLSCLSNGNRHPHQRRIPGQVLNAAKIALRARATRLSKASSFSELYDSIEETIEPIRGIGRLTTYDIAHRIGAFLNLEPELVYLHAGTKDGARALGFRGNTIDVTSLPIELRCLTAAEIEDCLCIYKHDLLSIRAGSNSGDSEGCSVSRRRKHTCAI
jgi:hypothetical protein